jgi:D-glycero-alpha-D-manno-heptose-7-phosphate kinase
VSKISAQAPCRVDLAGGTLDIWPLYLFHADAVTVNFAIDRHAHASIEAKLGAAITLSSTDLRKEAHYASLHELLVQRKHALPLAAEIIRFFAPQLRAARTGFHLETGSEAPAGAGISGSSALIIAAVSAFNRWLGCGHSIEKLREIAQNIEARVIRVPTGCQDYYPAMYGGVSAIEMGCGGIRHFPIRVAHEELERRTVLAYTGVPRNSGINNWEVTKAHIDGNGRVHKNFETIASIARAMREALERADWNEAARLLGQEWSHRRKNAPGISTPLIDRLVAVTRRAGVRAAKVCGAGGGGCVLFLVEPDAQSRIAALIEKEGASVLPVRVARRGVRVRPASRAKAAT